MARKILLADDSVTAQNMGRKILADAGYEVIAVNNGSAALKKIADAADPLYKTLDDGQKRRLAMLTHHNRHGGGEGGEGWRGRLQHGFGGGRDRGPDSERL